MYEGYQLTAPAYAMPSPIYNTLKRRLKVFGIYLLFINVFGTLIKSPVSLIYLVYGGYPMLFVDVLFFTVYFLDRLLIKNAGFTTFEWIIMILLAYIMLQAGIVTNLYFGQPVHLGMAAEKSWLAILISFIFFYLLKIKAIDLSMIRDALLFMAWFHLPIFFILIFVLNPNQFAGTLFVYCNTIKGGCQFEFDIFPFAFATIYYFIKLIRTNKFYYGLFSALFFAYIFFINQKRGTSLALLATLGVFFLLNTKFEKKVYYIIIFTLCFATGIVALYLFFPEVLDRIQAMYTNIALVLLGEETGEASADARIRTTLTAFKYFDKNQLSWLFGNGKLNNDWISGSLMVDFGHFYPSDIGVLGVIFQFGLIGLVIGLLQYFLVIRNHRRIQTFKDNYFYQAVVYFIIFFFIRGIPTGGSFYDPGIAIAAVFVCIHYFFYYIEIHPEKGYHRPN